MGLFLSKAVILVHQDLFAGLRFAYCELLYVCEMHSLHLAYETHLNLLTLLFVFLRAKFNMVFYLKAGNDCKEVLLNFFAGKPLVYLIRNFCFTKFVFVVAFLQF